MDHIPVLLEPVLEHIVNEDQKPIWILDGTFGRGGHCRAILEKYKGSSVIGLDRDLEAIEYGQNHFKIELESGRLQLIRCNYVDVDERFDELMRMTDGKGFDSILLDLGVSSPQLDQGVRGFSFYQDGPLDMRMDQTDRLTAAEIINTWGEQELSDLFYQLGEIRRPNRVVRRIVERRKEKPFERTADLSILIESAEGWQKRGHHPATNFFLALRLKVNQELEQVEQMIAPMVRLLKPGGRLAVITFHSTEDRLVKVGFKALKSEKVGRLVNKKVIQALWPEKKKNPRARSAKIEGF